MCIRPQWYKWCRVAGASIKIHFIGHKTYGLDVLVKIRHLAQPQEAYIAGAVVVRIGREGRVDVNLGNVPNLGKVTRSEDDTGPQHVRKIPEINEVNWSSYGAQRPLKKNMWVKFNQTTSNIPTLTNEQKLTTRGPIIYPARVKIRIINPIMQNTSFTTGFSISYFRETCTDSPRVYSAARSYEFVLAKICRKKTLSVNPNLRLKGEV